MDPQSEEETIRKLLQRVKAEDQRQIPSFKDVMLREVRVVRSPSRRAWTIAMAAAATLLIGFLVMFSKRMNSVQDDRGSSAERSVVQKTHPADLDFAALQGAIDQYFVSVPIPEWNTPSDSLLAIDFDAPFAQE